MFSRKNFNNEQAYGTMKNFEKSLYEATLVAFGKVLAKHNLFSQGTILKDVGKEIIDYLKSQGFEYEETGELADLKNLTDCFVKNRFADKLEVVPADKGSKYTWHNLYGIDAYKALYNIVDNPFLSCPLNLCLYYIADKHQKEFIIHDKTFDMESKTVVSQYEVVNKQVPETQNLDPLVIENIRLYELAEERAQKLEKALNELKVLRGIIPICSNCKKIRNDKGYWEQVESYISQHSEAEFSHGICPDCVRKLYPDNDDVLKGSKR